MVMYDKLFETKESKIWKGILIQTLNLSFSLSIRSTNIDIQVPEPLRIFLLVAKLITS